MFARVSTGLVRIFFFVFFSITALAGQVGVAPKIYWVNTIGLPTGQNFDDPQGYLDYVVANSIKNTTSTSATRVTGGYYFDTPTHACIDAIQYPQGLSHPGSAYTQTCLYSVDQVSTCPSTYHQAPGSTICIPSSSAVDEKHAGQFCPCVGNPISPVNEGNKFQKEIDFASASSGSGLTLEREYNSFVSTNTKTSSIREFGPNWTMSFDRRLVLSSTNQVSTVYAYRPDGKTFFFSLVVGGSLAPLNSSTSGGGWVSDSDVNAALIADFDSSGNVSGWRYQNADDETEWYDPTGKLLRIQARSGYQQFLTYSDGTATGPNGAVALDSNFNATTDALPAGAIIAVADSFGRSLKFGYDSFKHLVKVTTPAGDNIEYTYNTYGNVATITYPDSKIRSYLYNETVNIPSGYNFPAVLTGITDENSQRFATWKYNAQSKAASSEHDLPGNVPVEKVSITYGSPSSTVTDSLNTARTFTFQTVLGVSKSTALSQPCSPSCGATAATSYDTNGNVATRTDFNGNQTTYIYDLTRNLETSRTEALTSAGATTPQTRTITTQWHPNWRLETLRAEPRRLTTWVYNGQPDPAGGTASCAPATAQVNGLPIAVVCKKIEQSTTDETGALGLSATVTGTPRVWSYTYNDRGQVKTAKGPRTDVDDTTKYFYYETASSSSGSVQSVGDLAKVTNAVGHDTLITNYDLNGRPLAITDPNGIVTTLTYWPRGWLKTRTVNGVQTTSYDYDNVGQLKKVTLPDGSYLSYTYDTAHRLTDITDNAGNSIHYTLDAMGNRTKEDTKDPLNAIQKTRSRVYDGLNRLYHDIGGTNPTTQITEYGYDNNGNLKTVTDPLAHLTTNNYDELNRLKSIVDANSPTGTTQNTYDGRDQLTQVQDPRLVTTAYTVDGLGNVSLTQSPDSGNTTAIYDAAGNLTQKTDARGIVTNYVYDAINRLTNINYPASPSENVEFVYDYNGFADFSKGHLSYINDADGFVIVGAYDEYGNIGTKADWLSTVNSSFEYTYDNANRVASITYPSGRVVEYTRNALGQITQVQLRDSASASPQTVVNNVTYKPFGPLAGLSFGNGVNTTLTYDADYRVTRITATSTPNWDYSYGYDAGDNITALTDEVGINDRLYTYDALNRLTLDNKTTAGTIGQTSYQYDAGGNRTLFKQGTGTALSFTQTYASTSNRETAYGSQAMTQDNAGNLAGYGTKIFTYDSANRMSLASVGSTNTTYRYNGLGQRTTKLVTTGGVTTTTHYDYDRDGKYLGQTQLNADGTYVQGDEYIWMDDLPIAQVHTIYGANNAIASEQLLYIHADNLNTPRAMTDATRKVVWKWESEAYGRTAPNTDPDGDGVQAKLDLRFPGQIADAETGLFYDGYRYYDPVTGRMTQYDLISPVRDYSNPVLQAAMSSGIPLLRSRARGISMGLNQPYAYALDNPISNIDRFGLENGDTWNSTDLSRWNNGDNSVYPADANLNPPTKISPCELKCSLVVGSICKPIAMKTPGAWWVKVGSYAVCEVGIEYACRSECEKKDCPTDGK